MFSRNSINNGLFMGLVFIVASYSIYMTDVQSYVTAKSWILFIPFLILLFKTGSDARRKNEGIITFKHAFKEMYSAAAIGTFLCTSFEFIMFNFIDPSLKVIMKKLSVESIKSMNELLSDKMQKGLIDRLQQEELFTFGYSLSQYFVRLIVPCLIFSLLLSLLIRRDKPIITKQKSQP